MGIIVPGQVLTQSKSSSVHSTCPAAIGPATGSATGRSTGPAGSTTPSSAPVSAPLHAIAPETSPFKPRCPSRDSDTRRALASALQWLIATVGMKDKLSRGQGDRQFKDAASDSDDDDAGGGKAARRRSRKGKEHVAPTELVRPFIMVSIVDPDAIGAFFILVPPPTYDWNDPLNQPPFIGTLTKIAFPELCNLILKYTAPGRAVRTIWGAIENVPPAAVPPVRPVEVQITDSEELEESPPLNPAFPHVEEDDYSVIDIPAEDSDYEEGTIWTPAGIAAKRAADALPAADAGGGGGGSSGDSGGGGGGGDAQEEPEAIEAPEMEEIVDTSHSDYDDAPENDHESSEGDEDEPEDEPQAPPIFHPDVSDCWKETSYNSTNYCQISGQCSEETNWHGSGGDCFFRRIGGRGTGSTLSRSLMLFNMESSTHSSTQPECIPESTPDIPVSSHQIPSSQLHGQGRSQRVYEFEYIPSSREEDESAPMPESDVSMWATASHQVECKVDLDEVVIKQLRSLHSRVRSNLMHKVKGGLTDSTIYGLGNLVGPEARAAQVEYLLKNDRFLSPQEHYETYQLRFLAPEIIHILYFKYFDAVRIRGVRDPEFLQWITTTLICLISTAIWHGTWALSTGNYLKPDNFQSQNESVVKTFNRMSNTWKGRSKLNQEATLEVIKDNLREKIRDKKGVTIEVIPEEGFSEDDEALAADLAAFRNARRIPTSAPKGRVGSDSAQDEVINAQLRGVDTEEEGEEEEEEPELPIVGEYKGGGVRMCTTIASAKEDSGGFVLF
ncbi:uncharacterized protein H6S33_003320, partial [Morchella sextelata]|uniref:uncharacterized protein n=1 Tax=Morchella sextelata TaxID=1174677 RepID=UPI001D0486BF